MLKPKTHIITFADDRILFTPQIQAETDPNLYETLRIYNELSLPKRYRDEIVAKHKYITREQYIEVTEKSGNFINAHNNSLTQDKFISRGFCYWTYKPIIIKDTLDRVHYDDIVIYVDSNTVVQPGIRATIPAYMIGEVDILLKQYRLNSYNSLKPQYKSEALEYFNHPKNAKFKRIVTNFIAVRKTQKTLDVFNELCEIVYRDYHLFTDWDSKGNIVQNWLHDQSVMTLYFSQKEINNSVAVIPYNIFITQKSNIKVINDLSYIKLEDSVEPLLGMHGFNENGGWTYLSSLITKNKRTFI